MRATLPTNPVNDRARRKGEAGTVWEHLCGLVLQRVGLLEGAQVKCEHQYPGLLRVSGKIDYLMGSGGTQAILHVTDESVPPAFRRAGTAVGLALLDKYPEGLPKAVVEIKSLGSFIFERVFTTGRPSRNHRMQVFSYLKSTGIEKGLIIYVCRDDARIVEIPVFLADQEVEDEYRAEIEKITHYHQQEERPPVPQSIIWDKDKGRFASNWTLEYSDYLTLLCPQFETQAAFHEYTKPITDRWNRLIRRMVSIQGGELTKGGKPILLTAKNIAAQDEIRKAGHDPYQLLAEFSASEETEDEDNE
jgi:hypothetical protein